MKIKKLIIEEILKILNESIEDYNIDNYLLQHNINPNDLSYLGSGDFGEAYSTNDGRVVKITTSKSEYELAKKMVNKKIPALDGFVDIYAADEVNGYYVIIMEELDPDSDIENLYYQLQDYLDDEGLPIQYVNYLDIDELNIPEELIKFINDIEDINYAYRYLGIEASDLRPENLGYDKNGKVKAFDIDDRIK